MIGPMPLLVRGDARRLPLPDQCVDLVVTSPPYFGLREYRDHGGTLAGQLGAEPTPREFIDALIECTAEWARVLKPAGSIFVNLGDKYSTGSSGDRNNGFNERSGRATGKRVQERSQTRTARVKDVPPKSLLLLPELYRVAAVYELGLIARAVIVWDKPNGLPESVTDRVRRSHEDWVHLTRSPRYYEATDEIREQYAPASVARAAYGFAAGPDGGTNGKSNGTLRTARGTGTTAANPLGKLPGSVWEVPTQPLNVPDRVVHARCCGGRPRLGCTDGLDHYAAFPMLWPRRLITGWCPREVCTACGEGRRPVVLAQRHRNGIPVTGALYGKAGKFQTASGRGHIERTDRTITGHACACPDTAAPTRPGVVLDPCSGTGTTALVAAMLGRVGIGVDLSHAYTADLATWRVNDPKERARAAGLDPDAVAVIRAPLPGQLELM